MPAVGRGRWQLPVVFLQSHGQALLRFPFPSNPANWRHRKLVNTYVLPPDGGSRGLAAHSEGFLEVSLLIRSCQLETQEAGNYLCSSCRWWEQGSGSSQSGLCWGFPFHQILPTAWWHMKLIITYVLPGDGVNQGLGAYSLGSEEVSLLIKSCQLMAHEADNYLCTSCRWWEQRSGSSQSGFCIGFPFH